MTMRAKSGTQRLTDIPPLIIRCVDANDIARTVQFAERHNALLSVRGGGHNHVGFAVYDDGLMIDLARLDTVELDAEQRVATVGGGATFSTYDTAKFRLPPLKNVLAGLVFHPLEELPEIAAFVRDFNANAPDEVGLWLTMRKAPVSPALPCRAAWAPGGDDRPLLRRRRQNRRKGPQACPTIWSSGNQSGQSAPLP
jgi:FAD binding domain